MNHTRKDLLLTVSKALPAAGATAYSSSLNLGLGSSLPEHEVRISIPALPALADAKTLTVTLQDSADDSSFTDIPELSSLTLTGVSTNGAAAATRDVKLPTSFRGYLRAKLVVASAGGDNTGVSATLEVLT